MVGFRGAYDGSPMMVEVSRTVGSLTDDSTLAWSLLELYFTISLAWLYICIVLPFPIESMVIMIRYSLIELIKRSEIYNQDHGLLETSRPCQDLFADIYYAQLIHNSVLINRIVQWINNAKNERELFLYIYYISIHTICIQGGGSDLSPLWRPSYTTKLWFPGIGNQKLSKTSQIKG